MNQEFGLSIFGLNRTHLYCQLLNSVQSRPIYNQERTVPVTYLYLRTCTCVLQVYINMCNKEHRAKPVVTVYLLF